jgi:hypothetical protein
MEYNFYNNWAYPVKIGYREISIKKILFLILSGYEVSRSDDDFMLSLKCPLTGPLLIPNKTEASNATTYVFLADFRGHSVCNICTWLF